MDTSEEVHYNERDLAAKSFKAFLLKSSSKTNLNLYDHLAQLLTKVMDESPEDVVETFEDMSQEVKRAGLQNTQSTLRDTTPISTATVLAEQQRALFSRKAGEDPAHEEYLVKTPLPNVPELAFYLEQAGVGLGEEEMHRVFLALKELVDTQPLQRCRFWGKILGSESNYFVAEGEFQEGGGEEDETAEEEARKSEHRVDDLEAVAEHTVNLLQKSADKSMPVVPMEDKGTGANKYTYFVCREPGMPWVRLPSVTPAQIIAARQICKFFTGRLDAPIASSPPFPGNEANYLRAQIARISASTQVSPLGFYQFAEEEGEEDEETPRYSLEENPDFEGIPVSEMAESLSTWVHHVPHILEQGRCVWVDLAEKPEELVEEEEGDEDREDEPDKPEAEVGPPLLTPVSEDAEINKTPSWTAKMSSTLVSQFAIAVLRSNLWPGAYSFAFKKKFENIYVGWGLKFTGEGYNPPAPPPTQQAYPSGPEIMEDLEVGLKEKQGVKSTLEERRAVEEEESEEAEGEEEEEEED
ncbi:radial spoke head protein 4 homolog A-like [Scleropages formosus]|uniref:Radial spoke head component 4A n=1 Tax=Scleropages formosus TaxID=113540 RepID=A0A8C9REA7_SCLFO|nr:radial spoke head protein 4 homolog A-like [Scleropages formosus]